MPLPQLNTNIDYSNALNSLVTQEQNRRRYEEAVAFRNRQAEGQNKLRIMQMENLQDERQSRADERESRNALRAHQENIRRGEIIKMYSDIFTNGVNKVGSLEEANRLLSWTRESGLPAELLPDDFKTWEEFEKFKVRSNAAVAGLQKGNWENVTVYGPGGKTKRVPVEKGKLFDPEAEFGKGWGLTAPKEVTPKAPKEKNWGKISSTIMLQSSDPDLVKDYVYQYNQEAPGHDVFVVETKEGWKVPGLGWKGGKDESKIVRKTLPKINGRQLGRDDVAAYAESRGVTHEEALERIMKYSEKKPSKSTEPTKSGSATRSY